MAKLHKDPVEWAKRSKLLDKCYGSAKVGKVALSGVMTEDFLEAGPLEQVSKNSPCFNQQRWRRQWMMERNAP